MNMIASELLAVLNPVVKLPQFEVSDIVYDSRNCKRNCVFVCLRGAAADGHRFVEAAVASGAGVIVAEEPVQAGVPVVVVENTRKALALLSAAFFDHPAEKIKTIGITGTKGKTTTAFMVKSILEAGGHKVGVIGTIGVLIGETLIQTENTTPESYLVQKYMGDMVEAGCEYCVMEASSIGLKDYRVYGFTFDCGVFTNFSEDHIGGVEHKDMEEYLRSKALLFQMCKVGAINLDDPKFGEILKNATCKITTFGFDPSANLWGSNNRLLTSPGLLGCSFDLHGETDYTVEVSIPGKFNAYNALAAISACNIFHIPEAAIKEGLQKVKVKGRVEPVTMPGDFTLLIDYAHNAVSMESILSTLREYHPERLVCMFGAGGNRPKVRRYEMGEVCGIMADLSVITADNSRFEEVEDIIADIKTGMAKTGGKYIEIPDRRQAIRYCIENAQVGDIVVLAGKGHEDYQEIKGVKYPFDEREIIAGILEDLRKAN
ncbi:MAG: UDP-N-acetylmuramoyl-L-alanyl-D-glutamate--2,6-diaminopimelate ligase [Oscillospiraceae bacterium]